MKTETCKLYSGVSEYFCQISSKSIHIVLSYTVSKLGLFFMRHSVDYWISINNNIKIIND